MPLCIMFNTNYCVVCCASTLLLETEHMKSKQNMWKIFVLVNIYSVPYARMFI